MLKREIRLRSVSGVVLAIDVTPRHTVHSLYKVDGPWPERISRSIELPVQQDPRGSMRAIIASTRQLEAEAGVKTTSVMVSVPGYVTPLTTRLTYSRTLPQPWNNFSFDDGFADLDSGLEVHVVNDTVAAVTAEHALRRKDLIGIVLGEGAGCAVTVNGEISNNELKHKRLPMRNIRGFIGDLADVRRTRCCNDPMCAVAICLLPNLLLEAARHSPNPIRRPEDILKWWQSGSDMAIAHVEQVALAFARLFGNIIQESRVRLVVMFGPGRHLVEGPLQWCVERLLGIELQMARTQVGRALGPAHVANAMALGTFRGSY